MNLLPPYTISFSIKHCLVVLIKSYKYMISGFLPPACRFTPGCSNYAIEALQKHGAIQGCLLIIRRLLRCHPFNNKTGYDPVP